MSRVRVALNSVLLFANPTHYQSNLLNGDVGDGGVENGANEINTNPVLRLWLVFYNTSLGGV